MDDFKFSDDPAIRTLQINLRILTEEIMPRLMHDLPKARSDKQRAAIRVTRNYTWDCMQRSMNTLKVLDQPLVKIDLVSKQLISEKIEP